MTTIGCRFQGKAVKDHLIRLGVPGSEQSILDQFQHDMFIEPDLKQDQLSTKDLEKVTSLVHENSLPWNTLYVSSEEVFRFSMLLLRVMSCSARFLKIFFKGLQFVSLPLLNSSKDHYKKFSNLYGEILSDKDRPSRTPVPSEEEKQVDKVRSHYSCVEKWEAA